MTDREIDHIIEAVRVSHPAIYTALLTLRTQRDAIARTLADRVERERVAFVHSVGQP